LWKWDLAKHERSPLDNPVAAFALSILVALVAGLIIAFGIIWAFS